MAGNISFRIKESIPCPVCKFKYRREEMLTGGGRMNAGDITDELHRLYMPTRKYGIVQPLIYTISVCSGCLYAAFPRHFNELDNDERDKIQESTHERQYLVDKIFVDLDFDRNRDIFLGISSYILAAMCYEHRSMEICPTFLCGLCFLRAGWLCRELDQIKRDENYSQMARIFLRKASFFYCESIERHQRGYEKIEEVPNHGPDIDNNFGFDGILYVGAVLLFKYGAREPVDKRITILQQARLIVSRVVGMGFSSKSKPSVILELGRKIHEVISDELRSLQ